MWFETGSQLWQMNGHGPYVWASYVIFILVLLGLWLGYRQQKRTLRQHWQQLQARRKRRSPPDGQNLPKSQEPL